MSDLLWLNNELVVEYRPLAETLPHFKVSLPIYTLVHIWKQLSASHTRITFLMSGHWKNNRELAFWIKKNKFYHKGTRDKPIPCCMRFTTPGRIAFDIGRVSIIDFYGMGDKSRDYEGRWYSSTYKMCCDAIDAESAKVIAMELFIEYYRQKP
jgi:hypothetical protein